MVGHPRHNRQHHCRDYPSRPRARPVAPSSEKVTLLAAILFALTVTGAILAAPAAREIPPAFGPYLNLKPADFADAKSFRSTDRIVGTYYFYWYDAPSKAHVV